MNNDTAIEFVDSLDEDLIRDYMPDEILVAISPTEKDSDFNSINKKALGINAEQYSNLLKAYVDNANSNLKTKKVFKFAYFILSSMLLLMIVLIPIFMFLITLNKNLELYQKIVGISGFTISFIGVVIIIPEKITKYLFNSKEDEYINNIVTTIIAHDEKMFDKCNL